MKKLIFILGLILLSLACKETPTISDVPGPVIEVRQFSVSPDKVLCGANAILSWEVVNADLVFIDHGFGKVNPAGSWRVRPDETTTYNLTAWAKKQTAAATVTLTVNPQALGGSKIATLSAKNGHF
jgi:hypothetical protein